MLTPAGLFRREVERLRTRDPELHALRRAVRAAIVVPLAAAVSFLVVGGSQAPLFTIIGSIWLMVLSLAIGRAVRLPTAGWDSTGLF
jgi:hypothetical protein